MIFKAVALIIFLSASSVSSQETGEPIVCESQPNGQLVPYPGNCSLYYSCVNEIGWVKSCDPFVFNPVTTECDYPENVLECGGPVGGVECNDTGIDFQPNINDCIKYFICVDGTAFPAECAPGLLFDATAKTCLPEADVTCSQVNLCRAKKDGEIVAGNKCNEYLICVSEEGIAQNCLPGLEWDQEKQQCVKSVLGCPRPPLKRIFS